MRHSPEWHGDRFVNAEPMWTSMWGAIWKSLSDVAESVPSSKVPVRQDTALRLASPPETDLRLTWFGHSSTLVELEGTNVLFDPIWSDTPSPVTWAGPKRWFPPPVALEALPRVDAVIVSHDHYDHLDRSTTLALAQRGSRFIVPLGVGAHLLSFGISEDRITELDWWQSMKLGAVEVTATPARHASGRINPHRDDTLWAGYALRGKQHRVWYSGDTGYHQTLTEIGERLGPFDVTLIESGQYDPLWPDWHLGPEQAVLAHKNVRGKMMIPVHWALFKLANHSWTEPGERVLAAARCYGVEVALPRPGEAFEPLQGAKPQKWWPEVSWKTGREEAVVATLNGDPAMRRTLPPCGP